MAADLLSRVQTDRWRSETDNIGSWRMDLPVDSRQNIVQRLQDVLQKISPSTGTDTIEELFRIAEELEDRTFRAAVDRLDYLRTIALKTLALELTRAQASSGNTVGSTSLDSRQLNGGHRAWATEINCLGRFCPSFRRSVPCFCSSTNSHIIGFDFVAFTASPDPPMDWQPQSGGNGNQFPGQDSSLRQEFKQMSLQHNFRENVTKGKRDLHQEHEVVWLKLQVMKELYYQDLRELHNMLTRGSTMQITREQSQKHKRYKDELQQIIPYFRFPKDQLPSEFTEDNLEMFVKQVAIIMEIFTRLDTR